ncbi:MAG TPA: hypothetical protein VE641_05960 [Chthoniobacterales bacterium]|nr:hypothetical protein [Chthoniobacterales bacterium]
MTGIRMFLLTLPFVFSLFLAFPGNAADFESRFQEIVQSASNEQLYRFLYALPKGGDLHIIRMEPIGRTGGTGSQPIRPRLTATRSIL